jgi:ethanolamine utilization cobalamin adenosyltransferase
MHFAFLWPCLTLATLLTNVVGYDVDVERETTTLAADGERILRFLKNIFVANGFISPFNAQTVHIKSVMYIHNSTAIFPSKTLYPCGIRTRVFLFLRRMRCPLRHAAKAI